MSRQQAGLNSGAFGETTAPHVERRNHRLAVQFYGALTAHDRATLGPEVDPSLATCEQLPDPDAVPDFPEGGLSDPGDGDLLGVVFQLGVEDTERATEIALEAKHSADAREALYAALGREDGDRREKVLRLLEHGALGEARRLALCGRQSVQLECPDGLAGGCGHEENYVPISCGSRLCPDCMNAQIGKKVERYGRVAKEWRDPTFYTLTIRNVEDAEKGVDAIVGAFGRLRRRHIAPDGEDWHWYRAGDDETPATGWKAQLIRNGKRDLARRLQKRYIEQGRQIPVKELLKGGIYGIDVKQKGPDEWNVHLHVLADAHWIPQAALSATWDDLTGGDFYVYVERIYGRGGDDVEDALLETLGYACKAPEFESIEDGVEYMQAMKNRRFVQSFGTTHGNVPDLEGQLLCARCECTPAWWNYQGVVNDQIDNMGTTHGADSDDPPDHEHGKPPQMGR